MSWEETNEKNGTETEEKLAKTGYGTEQKQVKIDVQN